MSWKKTFYEGLKSGIPIGLGYLPVSFTFGFLAVSGGLPVWVAVFISLTNLTSVHFYPCFMLLLLKIYHLRGCLLCPRRGIFHPL